MQYDKAITAQVIIYAELLAPVGGIETFIYNLCCALHKEYDITVIYKNGDDKQIERLQGLVMTLQLGNELEASCDLLIMNSIFDKPPVQITAKKTLQLIHSCKLRDFYIIPEGRDEYIAVSQTAKDSYDDEIAAAAGVLHNIGNSKKPRKLLKLLSATRLTEEKGADRIKALAKALNDAHIPFIWLLFTANEFNGAPKGIVVMQPDLEIKPYIEAADYLVQLSDNESYCYSIVEAFSLGTPVITTPISVASEIGVEDGVNGYVVPFDMQGIDVKKIYEHIPTGFAYKSEDKEILKRWRQIIGKPTRKPTYKPTEKMHVEATQDYYDNTLGKLVAKGESHYMSIPRANKLLSLGLVKQLEN
ncbi:hypothetical protein [Butyrivibrio phage Idris]|uniref:Glycosyl transferase family 1 domain-containing protein n=2 Tax=Arawnvirus arawn TaxID=2696356 RepID=A0A6B9SXP3_9CAUD|nr:glycosyl transferase [Butyrivibrio phage Arawn]QHJ73590.1 glycosyl transferase [Butyrivibrio phage Arawn]QHJ73862.1 hypothetical protein [Butyrivibrio phage Idris]